MATLAFAYDHSRDPMNPGQLEGQIADLFNLTTQPQVDVTATQILVTHPQASEAQRTQIQSLINAYVYDPVAASFPEGNAGALMRKAQQGITVNNTFLALPSPSNAQVLAQVQRLTRENTALIKFLLNDFADTIGT